MIHRISGRRRGAGLMLLMTFAAVGASGAVAQQPAPSIDAGASQNRTNRLQQDLENRVTPRQADDGGSVTGPKRQAGPQMPGGGPDFLLKQVEFNPSHFFTQQELAEIARPYIGRKIDFAGIQALINAVNARYEARGIVTASASLPEQDLEGGTLRIELIEGRVGKVTVEGAPHSEEFVRGRAQLQSGSVVDVPELSARMSAQNRIGEAHVRTALQPGKEFGQTDVTLSVTEPKEDIVDMFVDTYGSPSTGRYQRGILFQHYGLLGSDDRLKLYAVHANGNLAGNASYTFGITPTGGRMGLSYSASRIEIVDGAFAGLGVTGSSQSGGVNFVQPFYSNGEWLAMLNLGSTLTYSTTLQNGIAFSENRTLKPTAGVTLNYYGNGFAASFAPSYAYGWTDLLVTDTHDEAHFFNGSASFSAVLPEDFSLQASGAWQWSSKPLVTGDQLFQIGSATTVRGYGGSAVGGGSGYYANIELHKSFKLDYGTLDVFAFVDNGAVYSTSPSKVSLTGVGFGVSYAFNDRLTMEATFGLPVGDPVPNSPDYTIFGRVIARLF